MRKVMPLLLLLEPALFPSVASDAHCAPFLHPFSSSTLFCTLPHVLQPVSVTPLSSSSF
uniref:Secreted protein n=1 Tax=Manihot esculenta TaxID=3983 RepID=A0A2C9U0F2_MANES